MALKFKTAVKAEPGVTEAAVKVLVQVRIDSKRPTVGAFVSAASLEYT